MKKVCLDPGHVKGYNVGYDRSYAEGTAMFNYAYKLKAMLEEEGIEVIVTRAKVTDNPTLAARGSKAKGCDLFVSLHSNGVDNPSAYGVSTFYSIKRNNDKGNAQEWCDKLAALIGTRSRGATTRKGGGDWDYYTVIQYAAKVECPHIFLIEHGFHSNKTECQWLLSEQNMTRMAMLERDIICDILGVSVHEDAEVSRSTAMIVNTPRDTLNVRKESNYKSEKVGELEHNSIVEIVGIASNGWKMIKQAKLTGWVNGSYLKKIADTSSYAKTKTPNDTLNVRTVNDYRSTKIGEIPNGSIVPVFNEANNGWILVKYAGITGWVNGSYAERITK